MQLLKVVIFACLIYGTSSRDWFADLDPYLRRLIYDSRDILNRECKNGLESQRENLRTGWPGLGIKPFDPINISRLELELGTTNLVILDAQLSGISHFNIVDCDLKVLGLYASISLKLDNVIIVGTHETTTKLGPIIIKGHGDLKIFFIGVNASLEVELGVISGNRLNLDDYKLRVKVETVAAHLQGFGSAGTDLVVSDLVGEAVKVALNAGELFVEKLFEAVVYPINVALNEITLPEFIVRIIDFIRRYN